MVLCKHAYVGALAALDDRAHSLRLRTRAVRAGGSSLHAARALDLDARTRVRIKRAGRTLERRNIRGICSIAPESCCSAAITCALETSTTGRRGDFTFASPCWLLQPSRISA